MAARIGRLFAAIRQLAAVLATRSGDQLVTRSGVRIVPRQSHD
ncbi:hypothetical protein [Azospirillum sp. INR13]|nr:hypothetical protein [Azospirillum sp. INR13]